MSNLIENQVAIDALMDEFKRIPTMAIRAKHVIEELPPAQPEPKWIPCNETIDIPNYEVLCCDKNGEELIGWLSHVNDQWLCESNGEMMYNPIAWRGKPEPYTERQKDDEFVRIKMEMPKRCWDCRFYDDNYDYPTCIVNSCSKGYNFNGREKRMDDCPLIQ